MITANESGAGYWARVMEENIPEGADMSWVPADDFHASGVHRWPQHIAALVGGSVTYATVNDEGKLSRKRYTLNAETIARGFVVMAAKYGEHFGTFLSGNEDAETGDVFLQCCLLGDVKHG